VPLLLLLRDSFRLHHIICFFTDSRPCPSSSPHEKHNQKTRPFGARLVCFRFCPVYEKPEFKFWSWLRFRVQRISLWSVLAPTLAYVSIVVRRCGANRGGQVGARELRMVRLCWRAPCLSGEPSTADPLQMVDPGAGKPWAKHGFLF
jgi:hypothetical protein